VQRLQPRQEEYILSCCAESIRPAKSSSDRKHSLKTHKSWIELNETSFYWSEKLYDACDYFEVKDHNKCDITVTLIEDTNIPQDQYIQLEYNKKERVEEYDLGIFHVNMYDEFGHVCGRVKEDFIKQEDYKKSELIRLIKECKIESVYLSLDEMVKKMVYNLISLCIICIRRNRNIYSKDTLVKYLVRDLHGYFF